MFPYLCVFAPYMCLVLRKAREEHLLLWKWSYRTP